VNMPCSSTPEVPPPDLICGDGSIAFRSIQYVGSSMIRISGLNHTAYSLAVYASPHDFSLRRKTRFQMLVRLVWAGVSISSVAAAYITLRLLASKPAGFYERVSIFPTYIPPLPVFPGARMAALHNSPYSSI
jgi:hypothetical protein